ncbi:MAG: glycoside hydrolase family 30 beta sandwich domain-containing protein [Gemmatimonadaceae bacterium]
MSRVAVMSATSGCNDCRGVVAIDSRDGNVTRNVEYYVLARASRFVHPGATRIASSLGSPTIDHVAFHNTDDDTTVLIVVNSANMAQAISGRDEVSTITYSLPERSVVTLRWRSTRSAPR